MLLFSVASLAQTETDIQLAQHYYLNGEFSKAVIDLLHSQDKRKNLGSKALEHFKNEHSFEIYTQRMDNFLGLA